MGKDRARNAINSKGMTLKAGSLLQRVTRAKEGVPGHAFYAVSNVDRDDVGKYRGLLGAENVFNIKGKLFGGKAYKTSLGVAKDIKIPSHKEASKVFEDLYKGDKDFRDKVHNIYNTSPLYKQFVKVGQGGKTDYEKFNIALADHFTKGTGDVSNKFYSALKSKGYGGVLDIHDQKYSGFDAKAPVIIFDTEKVVKDKIENLGAGEIVGSAAVNELAQRGSYYAAAAGLIGSAVAVKKYVGNSANKK